METELSRHAEKKVLGLISSRCSTRVLWWDCDGIIQGGDPATLEYYSQLRPCVGQSVTDILGEMFFLESGRIISDNLTSNEFISDGKSVYLCRVVSQQADLGILCLQHSDWTREFFVGRQALDGAIRDFVHEIRNPLSIIRAGLKSLMKYFPLLSKVAEDSEKIPSGAKKNISTLGLQVSRLLAHQEMVSYHAGCLLNYTTNDSIKGWEKVSASEIVESAMAHIPSVYKNERLYFTVDEDFNVSCVKNSIMYILMKFLYYGIYYQEMLKSPVTILVSVEPEQGIIDISFAVIGFDSVASVEAISNHLHLAYSHITGSAYEQAVNVLGFFDAKLDFKFENGNIARYKFIFSIDGD